VDRHAVGRIGGLEHPLMLSRRRESGEFDALPLRIVRTTLAAYLAEWLAAREGATLAHCTEVFERMAKASNGRLVSKPVNSNYWDHPAGGCRMGTSPATSVCDSYGRTHDHENLFVIGAPTLPTGGCTNGTLTFAALTLRSGDRLAESLRT